MPRAAIALLVIAAVSARAEPPEIEQVEARRNGDGTWRFAVTLSHPDTGWGHYADGWRVLDMDGNELGMRELAHPHVEEQPFTRALSGVAVPEGTVRVQLQARDKPGGWNDGTTVFHLP